MFLFTLFKHACYIILAPFHLHLSSILLYFSVHFSHSSQIPRRVTRKLAWLSASWASNNLQARGVPEDVLVACSSSCTTGAQCEVIVVLLIQQPIVLEAHWPLGIAGRCIANVEWWLFCGEEPFHAGTVRDSVSDLFRIMQSW